MTNDLTVSADVERRRRYVESALGSLRIEGLELDAEARAIVDRYIVGDLPRAKMAQAIRELH